MKTKIFNITIIIWFAVIFSAALPTPVLAQTVKSTSMTVSVNEDGDTKQQEEPDTSFVSVEAHENSAGTAMLVMVTNATGRADWLPVEILVEFFDDNENSAYYSQTFQKNLAFNDSDIDKTAYLRIPYPNNNDGILTAKNSALYQRPAKIVITVSQIDSNEIESRPTPETFDYWEVRDKISHCVSYSTNTYVDQVEQWFRNESSYPVGIHYELHLFSTDGTLGEIVDGYIAKIEANSQSDTEIVRLYGPNGNPIQMLVDKAHSINFWFEPIDPLEVEPENPNPTLTPVTPKPTLDPSPTPDPKPIPDPSPEVTSPYTINNLAFSFINSRAAFEYNDNYRIPLSCFQTFFSDEQARDFYDKYSTWSGSCWGFSSGTLLLNTPKHSGISPNDFKKNKVSELTVSDYSSTLGYNVTRFLETLQVSQFAPPIQREFNRTVTRTVTTEMIQMINDVKNGNATLYVVGIGRSDVGGHALVPYAVENYSTEDHLLVYDCNYSNQTRYITLKKNPTTGTYTGWYYPLNDIYNIGSDYVGSSIDWTKYDIINDIWSNCNIKKFNLVSVDRIAALEIYDENDNKIADIKDAEIVSYSLDKVMPIISHSMNLNQETLVFYLSNDSTYTFKTTSETDNMNLALAGTTKTTEISVSDVAEDSTFEVVLDENDVDDIKLNTNQMKNYTITFYSDGRVISSKTSEPASDDGAKTTENTNKINPADKNASTKKLSIKSNIKNKHSYKKSKKVSLRATAGIKTVKLNGKKISVSKKTKKLSFKLSKYKKYLKKTGKLNKLVITDMNGKKKIIQFKIK